MKQMNLQAIAKEFGGEVRGDTVLMPTPGHRNHDRGTCITAAPGAPDGCLVHCFNGGDPLAVKDLLRGRGYLPEFKPRSVIKSSPKPIRQATDFNPSNIFDYYNIDGELAYQVRRIDKPDGGKEFPVYHQDGKGGWNKGRGGPAILYRLLDIIPTPANAIIFMGEGERKADKLAAWGFPATSSKGLPVDLKSIFEGRTVAVLPDNDEQGEKIADKAVERLKEAGATAFKVYLPGLPDKGDILDWPGTAQELIELTKAAQSAPLPSTDGVTVDDFRAYMPAHSYIFMPSGEMWPASSVNSRIQPIPLFDRNGAPVLDKKDEQAKQAANQWLDQNRPVEQVTWAPGEAQVVQDRLISDGGWIQRPGCNVFNLYRPPMAEIGDRAQAGKWIEHVQRVYPDDAAHIIPWLAHRVQRPQDKINHAIVMGGAQGIGKDTILEPVKAAIGPWNFAEVSPQHMLGRFNGFVKSVILRVSEARDLGDVDRFAFYDHMKTYTAAPPDVLRVDEKHLREYSVFNVCGVIITTNHKSDGIYLPADDRRHYVAWSETTRADFTAEYWTDLYGWYANGGIGHVVAYLQSLDLRGFDAKSPPQKTPAFWDIVASNQAPEEAEMSDALEAMGWPNAVTVQRVAEHSCDSFKEFLLDRRNSRRIPHRFDECGYVQVRNDGAQDGLFKVNGRRCVIYARKTLSRREQFEAANNIAYPGSR